MKRGYTSLTLIEERQYSEELDDEGWPKRANLDEDDEDDNEVEENDEGENEEGNENDQDQTAGLVRAMPRTTAQLTAAAELQRRRRRRREANILNLLFDNPRAARIFESESESEPEAAGPSTRPRAVRVVESLPPLPPALAERARHLNALSRAEQDAALGLNRTDNTARPQTTRTLPAATPLTREQKRFSNSFSLSTSNLQPLIQVERPAKLERTTSNPEPTVAEDAPESTEQPRPKRTFRKLTLQQLQIGGRKLKDLILPRFSLSKRLARRTQLAGPSSTVKVGTASNDPGDPQPSADLEEYKQENRTGGVSELREEAASTPLRPYDEKLPSAASTQLGRSGRGHEHLDDGWFLGYHSPYHF